MIVSPSYTVQPSNPQGRLTLTTLVPVLTAVVTAAGTVYYTPYLGNLVPVWNGVQFVSTPTAEISNVLANSATGSAGPAAAVASKNYDLFAWNNAGIITLTRGGAWNSDTVRSATTENDLTRVGGVLVNLNTITNGPTAGYGTYLGTIMTDTGGATVTWQPGAQGTAGYLGLWNMYNRVDVKGQTQDSNVSWTYTTATIRQSNASAVNQISFVRGLNEDGVVASFGSAFQLLAALASNATVYIGLDSTTAQAAFSAPGRAVNEAALTAAIVTAIATHSGLPGLGKHRIVALELGDGTNANFFYGSSNHLLSVALRA